MNKLKEYIDKKFSFLRRKNLFIAVSGGLDSMTLLNLLSDFPNIRVLHVNYKLRANNSEKDEALVKSECDKLKIKYFIHSVTKEEQKRLSEGNLQLEARKIRYLFFKNQMKNYPDAKLLLAHHADDQIETFFLQLGRDSGISGLAAMKKQNTNIIRPLLPYSKKEILLFAQKNHITWREDQSNTSLVYNRNRFRNVWIPLLEKDIPSLKQSVGFIQDVLSNTLSDMQEDLAYYQSLIENNRQLMLEDFDKFSDVFLIELLRKLKLPMSYLMELKKLRKSQKGAKISIESSNSIYNAIIRESDSLFFQLKNQSHAIPRLNFQEVDSLPDVFDKKTIYLDKLKLKGKLVIRKWEIGDRIKPIGLKGSKLISDVLTEAKVPNNKRGNNCVLMDDEKMLWCVGLSVDRRAIANSKSQHILKVSLA